MSEKTAEMDLDMALGSGNVTTGRVSENTVESAQYPTRPHRHSGSDYMAPTKSAKAKVRSQCSGWSKQRVPSINQWNPSTKRGTVIGLSNGEWSSSGGGTATCQALKSPSPTGNGFHGQAKWMAGDTVLVDCVCDSITIAVINYCYGLPLILIYFLSISSYCPCHFRCVNNIENHRYIYKD